MGRYHIKCHVVRKDLVKVLSGSDKGKTGEVLSVYPKTGTAIVKGINIKSKCIKPSHEGAGMVETKEFPIRMEKLMVIDPSTQQPCRSGRRRDENGKLQRYFKKKSINKEKSI